MPKRAESISTVVGLFRVSTEAQEKEGYSLAAQQTAYQRDCRAFGWQSLTTFKGQESGSSLDLRRTIHELIAYLRARQPDAVWVIEQSRLTRGDELDVALLIRELRETGTKVVIERGSVIDPSDLEGAFLFRLKALMDRREWEVIAARNKRGKDEKAKQGLLVSGRPAYGYAVAGEGRKRGQRVIVPEQAAVVRQIFEWVAEGHSLRVVIQRLHERGISAPAQAGRTSGQPPTRIKGGVQFWGQTTLRRLLSNPIYLGVSYRNCWVKKSKQFVFDRANPKAIWIEDAHEAIVTPEVWEAAHRQLARRQAATHIHLHMLTGVLVCRHCGNSFGTTTSAVRPGAYRRYYECNTKRGPFDPVGRRKRSGKSCPSKWLRQDETDRLVWDAFVRLITSPEMIQRYLDSAPATKRRAALKDDIAHLTAQVAKIEQKLACAREKLLVEVLTDGEYLTVREHAAAELDGRRRRLAERNAELESMSGEVTMNVIRNLAMLKLGEKKLSSEQRSRLFHSLVRAVRFMDDRAREIEIELFVAPDAGEDQLAVPARASRAAVIAVPVSLDCVLQG